MATLTLLVYWDDDEAGDMKKWSEPILLDGERLRQDQQYGETVHDYLERGLKYLAREAELIKGSTAPEGPDCG